MVIWLIGLSGAGKTTIGKALCRKLRVSQQNIVFIDGDIIRQVYGNDLGHSISDRKINASRICRLCKWLESEGQIVVCAILSLFPDSLKWNRKNYKKYLEIYIYTSIETLKNQRDYKGLYSSFQSGKIKNVAGLDLPFTPPEAPDITIDNNASRSDFSDFINLITKQIDITKCTEK